MIIKALCESTVLLLYKKTVRNDAKLSSEAERNRDNKLKVRKKSETRRHHKNL